MTGVDGWMGVAFAVVRGLSGGLVVSVFSEICEVICFVGLCGSEISLTDF